MTRNGQQFRDDAVVVCIFFVLLCLLLSELLEFPKIKPRNTIQRGLWPLLGDFGELLLFLGTETWWSRSSTTYDLLVYMRLSFDVFVVFDEFQFDEVLGVFIFECYFGSIIKVTLRVP